MALHTDDRQNILRKLGAMPEDLDVLLDYTTNVFSYNPKVNDEGFLLRWAPVLAAAKENGAASAINQYLVREDLQIAFENPDAVAVIIYESFAGKIPIITAQSDTDFERLVLNIIYKDKHYPHVKKQGASFALGEQNRFIILSHKPYSNLPASSIGLDDTTWREKSLTLRKFHECAHYYTKRYHGSSRNNLHDELIADFCGMWAAFSEYRAEYFTKFLAQGRMQIYMEGLSPTASKAVEKLAYLASAWVEKWTRSNEFLQLNETERIDFLCNKELLSYGGEF